MELLMQSVGFHLSVTADLSVSAASVEAVLALQSWEMSTKTQAVGYAFVSPSTKGTIAQKADKMLGSEDENLGFNDKKFKSRARVMSSTFEASELFKRSFPQRRYGKLENVFYEARKFINPLVEKDFTLRRARSIWEGTARRIDADEMDALRVAEIEEMKRDRQETRAHLANLDQKIALADKEYARQTLE